MRLHIIASAVLFGIGAATLAVSAEGEDTNSREATFRQLELFGDVLSRIEQNGRRDLRTPAPGQKRNPVRPGRRVVGVLEGPGDV